MSIIAGHADRSGTQAAVQSIIRSELDGIGNRLAAFRGAASAELERLAAFRWLTELAGVRGTEVAERAGVSRQTLANLRAGDRAADYEWPLDLRVMLELGLRGPQTAEDLVGAIARAPVNDFEVTSAIQRLQDGDLVTVAGQAASASTTPLTYLRLTAAGVEELPRRLRHAAMPPSQTWVAYVVSSAAEANALAAAGEKALGSHEVAVIPAGTASGMVRPEVAFRVEATDPLTAQSAAIATFGELRQRAGMTPRQEPVIVAALIPPERSR